MRFIQAGLKDQRKSILSDINWEPRRGDCWAILGANASGKSSLARLICGELKVSSGKFLEPPNSCLWVSLESQQALYEKELYLDETDLSDKIDEGRSVRTLMEEIAPWSTEHDNILHTLHLDHLVESGYRRLSSGEARRVLIARALLEKPELLILDEPFEGLDQSNNELLHSALNRLVAAGQWLILVVNQTLDIIDRCRHIALLDKGTIAFQGPRPATLEEVWQQLNQHKDGVPPLPERDPEFQLPAWPRDKALINLQNGFVQYDEFFQFREFNWQLRPGEHTRIIGPNGSGKSTLLGLITGDHPQCYRNNLKVLGFQRGSGESIWQIKKHIGYVSGTLHRDYRASASALSVIISGLTDTIGIYSDIGQKEKSLALHWLSILDLEDQASTPFRSLSMGQQRLLLIARALIKQPPLIILDEPTEGLDDFNRFYVLSIVEKLIEAGESTLLLVSHRQDETLGNLHALLEFVPSTEPNTRFSIQHSTY